MSKNLVPQISTAIASLNEALVEELDKVVLAGKFEEMIKNSPEDISARYWLMQFMEPLNRKELKQFVDGFLVQLLNEEQSKKLVKFLLVRFPNYYNQDLQTGLPASPDQDKGDPIVAKERVQQPNPVKAETTKHDLENVWNASSNDMRSAVLRLLNEMANGDPQGKVLNISKESEINQDLQEFLEKVKSLVDEISKSLK